MRLQFSELDLSSFIKLIFPLCYIKIIVTLFKSPSTLFWKLYLLAAWWKFRFPFFTKYSNIWVASKILELFSCLNIY